MGLICRGLKLKFLGKLSKKNGELKMSEAIMPEKPLVTSELMTCLLISSLRQS